MTDEPQVVTVPGPDVTCAWCGEEIPTSIRCTIEQGDGEMTMTAEPDISDQWSHYWARHADYHDRTGF